MPSYLRRKWSLTDKLKVVEETLLPGGSITLVAQKYCLHKNQVSLWRRLAAAGEFSDAALENKRIAASESLSNIRKTKAGDLAPHGRRAWSDIEKVRIVSETYENQNSVVTVSRRYGINPNQLYHWRRLADKGALAKIDSAKLMDLEEKKKARVSRSHCRRNWPDEEKFQIVEEAFLQGNSISSVARKYKVNPSQLFRWRTLYLRTEL